MWLDQFQFAGFYIAKRKAFIKKVGLDVEFKNFKMKQMCCKKLHKIEQLLDLVLAL